MMRAAVAIIFGLLAIASLTGEARAVTLTKGQVDTVCGNDMQSGHDVSGCKKKCGVNGEHDCEYSCYKGKDCQGYCTSCGVKGRVLFPKWYGNRLVKQSLRGAP